MLLELREVSKYFGSLAAVSDVDLGIAPGELVGLIGPNGAGKTTLFNIISGFTPPSRGTVRFDGQDIIGLAPHAIVEKGLCRTFQIVKPFGNLTVLQNVTVGSLLRSRSLADAERQARGVLHLTGLVSYENVVAKALPLGLRKRLEVARALATAPALLLLDEAMAGLSSGEIAAMVDIIRRLHREGLTIVIIEHIMAVVTPLCQRIVVLHHGEKIAEGPPAAIVHDRQVLDAYLGEDFALAEG